LSLKPIPAKQLIRILSKTGFTPARQRGSHIILRHEDGRIIVVPVHEGEDIGVGLLSKIIKEAGLTREAFIKLRNPT